MIDKSVLESQLRDAKKHLEYSEWCFENGYQNGRSYELSSGYWKSKIKHLESELNKSEVG